MVTLDSGRCIQVDLALFDTMNANETVKKSSWARNIDVNGRNTKLAWSVDFHGMLLAMPLTVAIFILGWAALAVRPATGAD